VIGHFSVRRCKSCVEQGASDDSLLDAAIQDNAERRKDLSSLLASEMNPITIMDLHYDGSVTYKTDVGHGPELARTWAAEMKDVGFSKRVNGALQEEGFVSPVLYADGASTIVVESEKTRANFGALLKAGGQLRVLDNQIVVFTPPSSPRDVPHRVATELACTPISSEYAIFLMVGRYGVEGRHDLCHFTERLWDEFVSAMTNMRRMHNLGAILACNFHLNGLPQDQRKPIQFSSNVQVVAHPTYVPYM
jgi:hypothetical protein